MTHSSIVPETIVYGSLCIEQGQGLMCNITTIQPLDDQSIYQSNNACRNYQACVMLLDAPQHERGGLCRGKRPIVRRLSLHW